MVISMPVVPPSSHHPSRTMIEPDWIEIPIKVTARWPGPLWAKIDRIDFERVTTGRPWSVCGKIGKPYAQRTGPNGGRSGQVAMHRFIMNAPAGIEVDHRNGDGLDNRRRNLRLATHLQNTANNHRKPGLSGFRGVTARPWGAFEVRVRSNSRTIKLGFFRDPVLAALAYDEKAAEINGEFAFLNFPPDHEGE